MQLRLLHEWLKAYIEEYIAMCEAGSVSAGDTGVEGRSDHDITIVLTSIEPLVEQRIRHQLGLGGFDDSYLFLLKSLDDFLSSKIPQDLSTKFRGKVIFGEDILPQKELPDRRMAGTFSENSLRIIPDVYRRRLLNSQMWSVEHFRDKTYAEFKRLFVFLAAQHYAKLAIIHAADEMS